MYRWSVFLGIRIGADGLSKGEISAASLQYAQYPLFTRVDAGPSMAHSPHNNSWMEAVDGSLRCMLEVSEHVFAQVSVLLYVSFLSLTPLNTSPLHLLYFSTSRTLCIFFRGRVKVTQSCLTLLQLRGLYIPLNTPGQNTWSG